jgi:DNA-binding beta-propeller fold protein YncE
MVVRMKIVLFGLMCLGCGGSSSEPEVVWGHHGVQPGDFVKPRAAAIDKNDHLYIVDFTARIQVFDRDGHFLGRCWSTPDYRNGRPSGLSMDKDGNLIVSDSHYHCVRIYTPYPEGLREIRKLGGEAGTEPGQLGYVSDTVQDEDGNYYIAEFGENQRISKFDEDGHFVKCWGEPGIEPGQFSRVRALAIGPDGNRIQVYTRDGERVACWGQPGDGPGELKYPYDLAFNQKGELYVIEYGNHRVQKFTKDGHSLGVWGGPGSKPGQFHEPWALVIDSKGRVHVIDSLNHRVQRIAF